MKISSFCLITNPHKFGYAWLESIQSWLPFVDELVIIDGGSEEWVLDKIRDLKNSKIRIVSDKDTLWENDWSYSRMGKNFSRGYHECTGDIVIKFDIDYIVQCGDNNSEVKKFKEDCDKAVSQNKLIISFCRYKFITLDRYYYKSWRDLAINRIACKKTNISVDYGLSNHKECRNSWMPIVEEEKRDGVSYGQILDNLNNTFASKIKVFNYGFSFSTEEQIKWVRTRHIRAEYKFKGIDVKLNKEDIFKRFIIGGLHAFNKCRQYPITINEHPALIQDKIKNVKPNQRGYDFFGNLPKSQYYE